MALIAVIATAFYLMAVIALPHLGRFIPTVDRDQIFVVAYKENRGILREILTVATQLGYEASLTKTRKIELVGKAPRVEADMRFRHGRGPLEDLVEGLSEIKGVISVQVTKDENE
jgi:putative Mg2+ transporter-C (MgtC) family protein